MRKDEAPEDRDKHTLKLPALLDCPQCDVTQDHVFDAGEGVFDVEDLIEAPVESITCVSCSHVWEQEYEGWIAHSDAG